MNLDFELEFFNETEDDIESYYSLIENILTETLNKHEIKGYVEACIVFVSNKRIQEINHQYRSKDQVTDVISFAMEDSVEGEQVVIGDNLPRLLGDIYISIDKCRAQASEYKHSFERELVFLALHGFLHLLGYDHMTKADEEVMFKLQEEILNANQIKR